VRRARLLSSSGELHVGAYVSEVLLDALLFNLSRDPTACGAACLWEDHPSAKGIRDHVFSREPILAPTVDADVRGFENARIAGS
jgi:hypothetical protein